MPQHVGKHGKLLDNRQADYVSRSRRLTLAEVQGWSRLRRMRNNLLALAAPLL